MALHKRRQYIEQPAQPIENPSKRPHKAIKKRKLITKQERFIYLAFVLAVAIMCVMVLHRQGDIQTATIDIQKLETSINQVTIKNLDYKVQISEKSTFERIMAKAKERGLTLNENNVKVVPGE